MAKKRRKKKAVKKTEPKAKKASGKAPDKKVPLKEKKPSGKKGKKPATRKGKKKPRTTRYNQVQKLLSAYNRKNGIKPGRLFNKKASEIYLRTRDKFEPKFIRKNFDALYAEYGEVKQVPREFDKNFPFYQFTNVIQSILYEGVLIRVYFKDAKEEFRHEGFALDMDRWYKSSGLYNHLRENYDESPTAEFILDGTDNVSYANYYVSTGKEDVSSAEAGEKMKESGLDTGKPGEKIPEPVPETKKEEPKAEIPTKPAEGPPEPTEKQLEMERLKIERSNKAIELMNKRMEYIKMLQDLGMTKEQIIEELKKTEG